MLAIKLQRIGKKRQPSYRLVAQEKRKKLGGLSTEDLGWFNPLQGKHDFKKERILYWISVGAKPTDTVHNLLVSAGVIQGPKVSVHAKAKKRASEKTGEEKPAVAEKPVIPEESAGADKTAAAEKSSVAEAPIADGISAETPSAETPSAVSVRAESPQEEAQTRETEKPAIVKEEELKDTGAPSEPFTTA